MIRNWLVTATLMQPLAGDPPMLDAVLMWEMALRLGLKHHRKLQRSTPLSEAEDIPIPLSRRTICGVDVPCCSSPILPVPRAEWADHYSKRFDSSDLALVLAPEWRRNLLVASGPYKMLFKPIRVRLVHSVSWFVRGDRYEMNKLLKSVLALGHCRNWGYGLVRQWSFAEAEDDCSIYAPGPDCRRILMRPVPYGPHLEGVAGWKRSYGGIYPPYWHPEAQGEIATPC